MYPPPSLSDSQGRRISYLRVSLTDRCNYRCTYCMDDGGIDHARREDVLSFEEIVSVVKVFVSLGVRRLRLTGGEPTLRKDLVHLVALLAALPGLDDIALSTNGHRLAEMAMSLRQAGVSRLNVSLDSLNETRFRHITRRGNLAQVLTGLEVARGAGFASIKLNAVAVAGFNDDEIAELCAYAWSNGFIPRFIEQMPMAQGALFVPGRMLSGAQIRAALLKAHPGAELVLEEAPGINGAGPARYWRLETAGQRPNQAVRRVGLITAMTEHFCDTCNRVRLSASGALHTCLAHDDAVDLRQALRNRGILGVKEAVLAAVAQKQPAHLFQIGGQGGPRKSMVQIGG